ncbi:MAG: hypothetical protein FOGNACKC_04861 [Anaerolineae bacterium]|nr:hypothetical protein [Anaerolineae bacterium]
MFHKNGSNWTRLVVIGVVALVGLIIVSGVATASSNCRKVNGKLVLNADTTGAYRGDIKGTSAFTADGFPSDTGVEGVVLLTGSNAIHTADGDLMTRDAIVLNANPNGKGEFAELDTVISGTGAWAGATGVIQATGTFIFGVGGEGDYFGEICTE